MNVKFTIGLCFLVVLHIHTTCAIKQKHVATEHSSSDNAPHKSVLKDAKKPTDGKAVRKRGIYHGGFGSGALLSHAAPSAFWPKAYAAQYGYNLVSPLPSTYGNLPGYAVAALPGKALTHAHAVPTHFNYPVGHVPLDHTQHQHTALLGGDFASTFAAAAAAAVPQAVPAILPAATPVPAPAVAPAATPFILRPGSAYVSSFNVNYPQLHAKTLVPLHAAGVQPVHPIGHVSHVPHLQPLRPLSLHTTGFVHQQIPLPAIPAFPAPPAFPLIPAQPSVPAVPALPAIPSVPAAPVSPVIPSFSVLPVTPNVPQIPFVPTSNVPTFVPQPQPQQPQQPEQPIFPLGVQPPRRPQQEIPSFPPNVLPVEPSAQFPTITPFPGTPTTNRPEVGSADAAPQIPAAVPQLPSEPELPAVQPAEESWRPIVYGPPAVDQPSLTLLPPYTRNAAPVEGYLPPVSSLSPLRSLSQQQYDGLFENLSNAEIEHIISQATLAAKQQDHQSHRIYQHHY